MGSSKTSTWVGGAVVVALLLLIAGWFLLVSPVLAAAGETRTAAEDVEADNELARDRIEVLKAQFADLDASKATLADLQKQVPTTAQLAAYLRQVDEQAVAHGVAVTAVSPGTPEVFAPVAAAPATTETAPTDGAGTDGSSTDSVATTAPSSPGAGASAPVGLIDVPVSMTAVGSYANVLAWIQSMQEQTDRLLLVTSVTGTAQEETAAGGGKPQTSVGDVELSVTGYLYVLPGEDSIPAVTPEEQAGQLPAGDPNRNPLVG
jgi:hypothetical protein